MQAATFTHGCVRAHRRAPARLDRHGVTARLLPGAEGRTWGSESPYREKRPTPGCAGSRLSAATLQTLQEVVASEDEPRLPLWGRSRVSRAQLCTARRAVLPRIAGPLSPSSWLAAHLGHCWVFVAGYFRTCHSSGRLTGRTGMQASGGWGTELRSLRHAAWSFLLPQ